MPRRSEAVAAEAVSAAGLLVVALPAVASLAVASSGLGLVLVWVLASAITAAGAMPGRRMATSGCAVTPTTDYSGAFRMAGVRKEGGCWPPPRLWLDGLTPRRLDRSTLSVVIIPPHASPKHAAWQ